jgi:hypothetical protein
VKLAFNVRLLLSGTDPFLLATEFDAGKLLNVHAQNPLSLHLRVSHLGRSGVKVLDDHTDLDLNLTTPLVRCTRLGQWVPKTPRYVFQFAPHDALRADLALPSLHRRGRYRSVLTLRGGRTTPLDVFPATLTAVLL